jgi:fumarate hydratase, class II
MSESTLRLERDSLGELGVPRDALWGIQTQRAMQNFPASGLTMPRAFIRALGLIKQVAAATHAELGTLPADLTEAIESAAREVAEGRHDAAFPVDVFQTGSGTSSNMNANEVIATLAARRLGRSVHANDHVNKGQSSNDVIPTAIHLSAALQLAQVLLPALRELSTRLTARMRDAANTVKTGRTHLMDAMPMLLAQEIGAWRAQIEQGQQRLLSIGPRLHALAQGGTAIGTGVNTHPQFGSVFARKLSELTRLEFTPSDNYFAAIAGQDTAAELSGHLKVVAISLSKIANDLRWMNSGPLAGLAEISLRELQPGSSIMPGKVNPVVPEAVMMIAAQVIGNDATIAIAAQAGNFQLNTMLPLIAYNVLQSIELLAIGAQNLSRNAIDGMTFNTARMAAALERNPILVTALNDAIGYDRGAAIMKRALAEGKTIFEIALSMTDIGEPELRRLLDPASLAGAAPPIDVAG